MSAVKKQFSELEFCEMFSKLNDNIEQLTNEVSLLKLKQ